MERDIKRTRKDAIKRQPDTPPQDRRTLGWTGFTLARDRLVLRSDIELARKVAAQLRDYDRTRRGHGPSAASMDAYRADVARLRKLGLLPEQAAGTKKTYYRYRAALLAVSAERARSTLDSMAAMAARHGYAFNVDINVDKQDATAARDLNVDNEQAPPAHNPNVDNNVGTNVDMLSPIPLRDIPAENAEVWSGYRDLLDKCGRAFDRYPPGEAETIVMNDGRCLWTPELVAPSRKARLGRSNDVERKQAMLPDGWMHGFWAAVERSQTEYRDAFAVTQSVGLRPEELKKGVLVTTDGRGLRFEILGAKTNRDHGFDRRVTEIAEAIHPWHRHLVARALADGFGAGQTRSLPVAVRSKNAYSQVYAYFMRQAGFWAEPFWRNASASLKGEELSRVASGMMLGPDHRPGTVAGGLRVTLDPDTETLRLRTVGGRLLAEARADGEQPWVRHLVRECHQSGGDIGNGVMAIEIAAVPAADWKRGWGEIAKRTDLWSCTAYVARHAVIASLKAELAVRDDLTPEERKVMIGEAVGQRSVRTQGGYGRASAAKGSVGITNATGMKNGVTRSASPPARSSGPAI